MPEWRSTTITKWKSLTCAIIAAASVISGHAQPAVDIQMTLSKTTVILGEPVWVEVAVTNRSREVLRVDMGANCIPETALKVAIPAADPGPPQNEHRCYWGSAGSCAYGLALLLEPGDTLKRRDVLEGDFRITHPGHYQVLLEKPVSYSVEIPGEKPSGQMKNTVRKKERSEAFLDVEPVNPTKLLSLEQGLAAQYARLPKVDTRTPGKNEPSTDPAALQRDRELLFERNIEISDANVALAAGLAEYPAAGMEPVFDDWLMSGGVPEYYGFHALSKLNTAEARALLAKAANASADLYASWDKNVHWDDYDPQQADKRKQEAFASWRASALHALARMGDPSYLPLLEELAGDSSTTVRQEAISNLGLLGGEKELPKLLDIARNDPDANDRTSAITAMGDTDSLKAVPILIDLFSLPNVNQPISSDFPLMTLTHHFVRIDEDRTPAEYQAIWRQWWNENKAIARAYGPFECSASLGALSPTD
jgi:hypothetical protein